jgi:site-specific DNA recombinase
MTIAWSYLRVSGPEQTERGLPITGQREAHEAYAATHGITIERWFVDDGITAATDQRAEFQRMIEFALHAPIKPHEILVWSWSRFARDIDDAIYWKAALRRAGIEIVPINGEVPPDLPKALKNVLELVIHIRDEERLTEISRDVRRGQHTLARLGYIPAGTRPPPGYQVQIETIELNSQVRQARRWVIDPATRSIARRAWELRLSGATYDHIMAETGLYTSHVGMHAFFRNTAYKGYVTYSGVRIEIERLVSDEEWDKVQALGGDRRSGAYARRKGSRYLLSGLVRCARCGAALRGQPSRSTPRCDGTVSRRSYYVCTSRRTSRNCGLLGIRQETLEQAVIRTLFDDLLTPANMTARRQALTELAQRERPAIEEQVSSKTNALVALDQQISHLLDAIEVAPHAATLARRLQERETEREHLAAEVRALRAQLAPAPPPFDVDAFRTRLRDTLADPTRIPEARELLMQIVHQIIVGDTGTVTIHLSPSI